MWLNWIKCKRNTNFSLIASCSLLTSKLEKELLFLDLTVSSTSTTGCIRSRVLFQFNWHTHTSLESSSSLCSPGRSTKNKLIKFSNHKFVSATFKLIFPQYLQNRESFWNEIVLTTTAHGSLWLIDEPTNKQVKTKLNGQSIRWKKYTDKC